MLIPAGYHEVFFQYYVYFRFNSPPRLRAETRLKITYNLKPARKNCTILRRLFVFQRKSNQRHSHKLSFTTATAFQDFRKLRLLIIEEDWDLGLSNDIRRNSIYFITFFFLAWMVCTGVMNRHASMTCIFRNFRLGRKFPIETELQKR